MFSTIVGRYVGIISRKHNGTSVAYHKFEAVLIMRPIQRNNVYGEAIIPVTDTQYFTKEDKGELLCVMGNLTENALDQLLMGQVCQVLPATNVRVDDDPKKQRYDVLHRSKTSPKKSPKS